MPSAHNNNAAHLAESLREAIREEAKLAQQKLPRKEAEAITQDMGLLLRGPLSRMVHLELDALSDDPEYEEDNPNRDEIQIALFVLALAVNVGRPEDAARAREDIEDVLAADRDVVRHFRLAAALSLTLRHLGKVIDLLIEAPVSRHMAALLREEGQLDDAKEAEEIYNYAKLRGDATFYALDVLAQNEAVEDLCTELNITVADDETSSP